MPPTTSPFGPKACVISVWQVAHTSDCLMCAPSVGVAPVADRMTDARPRSTSNGPNILRAPVPSAGATTKRSTKLSGVPSRSGAIWWPTEHVTPSCVAPVGR